MSRETFVRRNLVRYLPTVPRIIGSAFQITSQWIKLIHFFIKFFSNKNLLHIKCRLCYVHTKFNDETRLFPRFFILQRNATIAWPTVILLYKDFLMSHSMTSSFLVCKILWENPHDIIWSSDISSISVFHFFMCPKIYVNFF